MMAMNGHAKPHSRDARIRAGFLVGLAVVLSVGAALAWRARDGHPKRFAEVVPGRLYRCGEVSAEQLQQLKEELGLHTVLSLLNPAVKESREERAAAADLDLRWVNVPLPGDGASTPEEREQIRAVLFEEGNAPLLVHCSAGTNRTGLAIGMYRIWKQGWTYEQVIEEMRRFDFEDEPHHENLRQALAAEARLATQARSAP